MKRKTDGDEDIWKEHYNKLMVHLAEYSQLIVEPQKYEGFLDLFLIRVMYI